VPLRGQEPPHIGHAAIQDRARRRCAAMPGTASTRAKYRNAPSYAPDIPAMITASHSARIWSRSTPGPMPALICAPRQLESAPAARSPRRPA
jgi:hypothetical protein